MPPSFYQLGFRFLFVNPFVTPTQELQFYDKYARWSPEKMRRETWEETGDRVFDFFWRNTPLSSLPTAGANLRNELRDAMLQLDALPSMRIMQMAGPALERCNVGAYNCAYTPIDEIFAFSELLYVLMQGTGCGFSVETEYVEHFPRVKKQKHARPDRYVVDDTTEGWCEALRLGLEHWFDGHDVDFDFSAIRPQGAVLKTKGGRASGPDPLKQLLAFARKRVLSRQGAELSSLDLHDIACMCGSIVQVGGVRRAAEISLSDLDDEDMRYAKFGSFGQDHPERYMANNSAVYRTKPSMRKFMEEWTALAMSGSGERGIFNRRGIQSQIPKRRKKAKFGINPCGEIVLRPRQFCNLSIAVARVDDTPETLEAKVRIAAIFGTLQSTLTKFNYIKSDWKNNCEDERLLGVDITGQMDCPLLRPGAPGRTELLTRLKRTAVRANQEWSEIFGINPSAAVTCVKPSGNSAQFLNCSSGIHPRYAKFYIRRFQIGAYTPTGKLLKSAGVPYQVPHNENPDNPSVLVFEFPMKSPEGAITRHDMNAIEQLDNWLDWKRYYTEHNPSATIYVDGEEEWLKAGAWVYGHWDYVGGIAFLPKDGGNYLLPVYEEIDEQRYTELAAAMPKIDFSKLSDFEREDMTEINREFACLAGVCEL